MSWEPELEELRRREELARQMGGEERDERQRASDRLTVRERIERLFDDGTFHHVYAECMAYDLRLPLVRPPSGSASRRSSTLVTRARSSATAPSARTSWFATNCTRVRRLAA